VTSTAAPVSAAAKQQHDHDDDQDQFHGESPSLVLDGGGAIRRVLNPAIRRPCLAGCGRFVGVAFGFQRLVGEDSFRGHAAFGLPYALPHARHVGDNGSCNGLFPASVRTSRKFASHG
jgi:hypothetical protein